LRRCIDQGLVGGESFAVDASLTRTAKFLVAPNVAHNILIEMADRHRAK
jgi:hypothetical protein